MDSKEFQFRANVFIQGRIIVKTGLAIGGSRSSMNIGGVDNPVIKTIEGEPYIPGSSLKGKIRSLLEKYYNGFQDTFQVNDFNKSEKDYKHSIATIFGHIGKADTGPTRLIVRDAEWDSESTSNKEILKVLEGDYTEEKSENSIDRKTGRTKNKSLRQMERVPKGAEFLYSMSYKVLCEEDYDNFNLLKSGFGLLEDDYLGGNGTRGYGQVEIKVEKVMVKTISHYERPELEPAMFNDWTSFTGKSIKDIANKEQVVR